MRWEGAMLIPAHCTARSAHGLVLCLIILFIYFFWWHWVFVACSARAFSSCRERRQLFLAALGLLLAAASLALESRLQWLQHTGSVVAAFQLWGAGLAVVA